MATSKTEFDDLAHRYKQSIVPWMGLTGEDPEFYAQSRVALVAEQAKRLGRMPRRILDFGCGIGLAVPYFIREFGSNCQIVGVDVSWGSLEVARSEYESKNVNFYSLDDYTPDGSMELAFCNGVFHHIAEHERDTAAHVIHEALCPGGLFALWENNPWNPIVKYNMTHAEIDRNAIPITSLAAKKLVASSGFELLGIRYHFVFPKLLGFLRGTEPLLSRLPVGAQYYVLGRKIMP